MDIHLHLFIYFVWASSDGSGENARMRSDGSGENARMPWLVWAFAVRICDKHLIFIIWLWLLYDLQIWIKNQTNNNNNKKKQAREAGK